MVSSTPFSPESLMNGSVRPGNRGPAERAAFLKAEPREIPFSVAAQLAFAGSGPGCRRMAQAAIRKMAPDRHFDQGTAPLIYFPFARTSVA
jgi:hypothetical protein